MSVRVLILVELDQAGADQCNDFDDAMAARQWTKLPRMGAIYSAGFEGCGSDASVLAAVQVHIDESAKSAGVLIWDGVCVISDSPPIAL